jgi:hypothetical protein
MVSPETQRNALFLSAKSRQVKGCCDFPFIFNHCAQVNKRVKWGAAIQQCRPILKKVGLPPAE